MGLRSERIYCYRCDHGFSKPLHFFQLRTALQQKEIHTHLFKFGDPILDAGGRSDQTGPQSPVGDGIVFQGNALLHLCAG